MEPLHCSSYHSSPPHSERGRTKPRRSRWDTSLSISVAEERSFVWCWYAKYSVQTSFFFFVISSLSGKTRNLYWSEQAWGKMAIASVNFSRQIYPHLQLRQACKWVVGILTWACSHPVGGRGTAHISLIATWESWTKLVLQSWPSLVTHWMPPWDLYTLWAWSHRLERRWVTTRYLYIYLC